MDGVNLDVFIKMLSSPDFEARNLAMFIFSQLLQRNDTEELSQLKKFVNYDIYNYDSWTIPEEFEQIKEILNRRDEIP